MGIISSHGRKTVAARGQTLFDVADTLDCRIPSSCGRVGTCHECVIEVKQGMEALYPRTAEEAFLRENYRLACQATIENSEIDVRFDALRRSPRILTEHPRRTIDLDPCLRRHDGHVFYEDRIVDHDRGHLFGLAMDLGTTTVVIELLDLETGEGLYLTSFENPQRFGGSDVMNRISYDGGPYRGELHKAIVAAVNQEISDLCQALGIRRQMIYELCVAGNSTMRELFFNLDVQSIGQKPYKSNTEYEFRAGRRSSTILSEPARNLKLMLHPRAIVTGIPLIASHVGADTLADLLAIDMESQHEIVMLVDVGTNTEVVVGHAGRMITASCPAGPAFEGGQVSYGMPGCDGAIESIRFNGERYEYSTIGDVPPQGICGSGLIDLLAELRRHDLMTPKGVFANRAREIMIVPEHGITFSRQDASVLAQAKAANTCGQYIVMRHFGIQPEDISRVYLAGGFANYVNIENAIAIGFLPPVQPERITKIGNAALHGSREFLLSRRKRAAADRLLTKIEHVELETTPDFFEIFVEACQFKPMPPLRADLRILESA